MAVSRSSLRQVVAAMLVEAGLIASLAGTAGAQSTAERPASILVFPLVVADGDADTVIQITNFARQTRHARCYYVNGQATDPNLPPGPENPPVWEPTPFRVQLVAHQPTHWTVSRGRPDNRLDPVCREGRLDCDDAGIDPGAIPAAAPFRGELICVEVISTGEPVPGNALRGLATIRDRVNDVSKYNAIGLKSFETNDLGPVLCLGGTPSSRCPTGAEYEACPKTWMLSHLSDGTADALAGTDAVAATTLTVVPCGQDLETQTSDQIKLQFIITNEFEQTLSASTAVTCWGDLALSSVSEIFRREIIGGDYGYTRIRSPGDAGFLAVARTRYESSTGEPLGVTTAANLNHDGEPSAGAVIVLPEETP